MGIQGDMEGGSWGGYILDILTLVENFEMVNFKSEQKLFYCFPFGFFNSLII